jgi:hypothetical protein
MDEELKPTAKDGKASKHAGLDSVQHEEAASLVRSMASDAAELVKRIGKGYAPSRNVSKVAKQARQWIDRLRAELNVEYTIERRQNPGGSPYFRVDLSSDAKG